MFAVRFFIGFSCLFMISACNNNETGQDTEQASLPVVRGSELNAFVENSDLPVLVEFGVEPGLLAIQAAGPPAAARAAAKAMRAMQKVAG